MWEYVGRVGVALIVAGVVLTFGFIGVGPALVLLGILLILVRRARVLPSKIMTILIGGVAGLIAWYCVLPLGCTTTDIGDSTLSRLGSSVFIEHSTTVCSTAFGLRSPGGGWALVIGCVIGLGVGVLTAHAAQPHGARDRALLRK
jgi:hypothetical protein